MKFWLSLYTPKLPVYLVYMLQQVEYNPTKFGEWMSRLMRDNASIATTMTRQQLVYTSRAKLLLVATYTSLGIAVLSDVLLLLGDYSVQSVVGTVLAIMLLPVLAFIVLYVLSLVAFVFVVQPKNRKLVARSRSIFHEHQAVKIAVIGSYGKTTMKEMLEKVLSAGLNVAVTPGNKNVPVSHARFAAKLRGDEDVLVIEFGEGQPGDVAAMSETVKPDWNVITGIAPNHLDQYPSVDALAEDILSAPVWVNKDKSLLNGESPMLVRYAKDFGTRYSAEGVLGWKISGIDVQITGLSFTMKKGTKTLKLHSGLLGRHQVGPLACAAALADELGVEAQQIEAGIAEVVPYEHRMQPRNVSGAWLIDDTYNGNLEGLIAGLNLLSELEAKRKWYVTPGLVDQGVETERVHRKLGEHIAKTNPDVVVLMDNSARPIIESAMKSGGFSGELRVEAEPLQFYTGIEHQIAAGDIVMMQNDWTDNYN